MYVVCFLLQSVPLIPFWCWPILPPSRPQVRHPKVKERMFLDFALMKKIANFADRRPSLKWMNLGPSMEQFSNAMSAQVLM